MARFGKANPHPVEREGPSLGGSLLSPSGSRTIGRIARVSGQVSAQTESRSRCQGTGLPRVKLGGFHHRDTGHSF